MVLGKTFHLELPRRVVVYYLLFCLVALAWLAGGVLWGARQAIQDRTENACLSLLTRAASRIEIEYLRNGTGQMQSQVDQIRVEGGLAYCGIVSSKGHFLAHSTRKLVSQGRTAPIGEHDRWGRIERIRFQDESGRQLREFGVPLTVGNDQFGTLRMAFAEQNVTRIILSAAEFMPITFLGPVVLLAVGAVVLQRMVKPMADVETQLRRVAVAPSMTDLSLPTIPIRGRESLGWNRLVDQLNRGMHSTSLESRIGAAIESRDRNRCTQLLDSLPEGLVATDHTGHITFTNRAFQAFAGCQSGEEISHERVEDCFGLRESEPDSPIFNPDLAAQHVVVEVSRPNGVGERYLRLARHPIRSSETGTRLGHIWSVRDVTQQKLADNARDEFLDSATHELRTPLANIKAYAETLTLTDVLDMEQQKEFCNTINSEATRLARLIDDLLSVSSMEAGSLRTVCNKVEMDRLLSDVAEKIQAQMDQRDITFEVALSDKLPELKVDKDKLAATLVNLLGNAAKYTPRGGRVAMKARIDEQSMVIEIEDTGIGISEDELPRIFGKFFRSDDERVQAVTGTGLGLSLAYEVVRLHGGTLTAQSEINKGSTFTVALPIA